ncbi:MAG: ABC transporter substrate-binding protein [Pseudomonadota bacterium]
MKLSHVIATALAVATAAPAFAEITLAGMVYRTGPYAVSGVPFSDGYADYITLLNERDGGINGVPLRLEECEFGYNTDRGVECYEELKSKGALVFQPVSTGVTYQLIPRVHQDEVVLVTTGYGLTAASDGAQYPYVFNFPAHYWDAAIAQIKHLKEAAGGSLAGKTVMHMFHNSAYGKEPIPTLELLAQREGFTLKMMPIDHPGADQSAIWPQVEAANPDYILLWGWGVMNREALKGALDIGFPMENMMGVWWSTNESDLKPFGRKVEGYKAVTFHAVGTDFQIYNELNDLVYFGGKARGHMNNLGEVLYNRGMASAIYATEAIRKAMEIHGAGDLTGPQIRDGFENLSMDDAKFLELGMEGFTPPMQITCDDHGGGGLVAVTQWSALDRSWKQITDYYAPDSALIEPQVAALSAAFAEKIGLPRKGC